MNTQQYKVNTGLQRSYLLVRWKVASNSLKVLSSFNAVEFNGGPFSFTAQRGSYFGRCQVLQLFVSLFRLRLSQRSSTDHGTTFFPQSDNELAPHNKDQVEVNVRKYSASTESIYFEEQRYA